MSGSSMVEGSEALRVFEELAREWDEVARAARIVECALPRQMSEAIAGLIGARDRMDGKIREVGMGLVRSRPAALQHQEESDGAE